MNPDKKTIVIFFGGLALAVLVLVLGANFLLKLVSVEEKPASAPALLPKIDINLKSPEEKQEPSFQIQKGAVDKRPIIYTSEGFRPKNVIIQASDDIGCLITVVNQSPAVLRVGVNPHSPAGDPGADYGLIQPGETGILDVRYPGLNEIMLHNHLNPTHEFSVQYGEGCK